MKKKEVTMKIEEPLMGYANYNDKIYPFLYKDRTLQLLPGNLESWNQEKTNLLKSFKNFTKGIDTNNWIGHSYINARTIFYNVIFYVTNDMTSNNGFMSFDVDFIYQFDKDSDGNSISGFRLTGREINDFYPPYNGYDFNNSYEENKPMLPPLPVRKETLGSYHFQGVEIQIYIFALSIIKLTDPPLSAKSILSLEFSGNQNIEFILEIYKHCLSFFYFICARTNIDFDDLQIMKKTDEENYENFGIIKFVKAKSVEELDRYRNRRILKYEYLKQKSCLIFTNIANNTMYFNHYRSSLNATLCYTMDRIILDFVAFEREYRNIYSNKFKRSDIYETTKAEVLETLSSLKNKYTGKKKNYIKKFIMSISKSENSYSDKMRTALTDCENILLPFLEYDYENYSLNTIEEISDRINDLRNDTAHGNMDLIIKPIHISDFHTLENLLYAMRLKDIGIDFITIRKCIKYLKDYNIPIDG